MNTRRLGLTLALLVTLTGFARERTLPGVGQAMQDMIAKQEIAGAVTMVVTKDKIDPVKGAAFILMVQRSNFPNSDASDVRAAFQNAAAKALTRK